MIHPTAIIDPSANLAADVSVGPYSVIGANVDIGAGTQIYSHVVVKGPTSIGKNNRIFQFSTVGEDTPDLKYQGEDTRLVIGDNNTIREGVTIHRGTAQDLGETVIGDNNLMMAYVHIGHDSVVGSNCIMVNNASLAGHVRMGDWAILSGYVLVHQFCHVGAHSYCCMGAWISKDVPAYMTVAGNPAAARSVNIEGLKRRNFSAEQISNIRNAYKIIYRQKQTTEESIEKLSAQLDDCPEYQILIDSLQASTRGIVR